MSKLQTDTERKLIEATRVKLTPYIPHTPHVKQQAFMWLTCLEGLFGGAAGGGKSDALLMAALQYVDVPGYSAILFRKTFPELKMADSLIPRADEWLRHTDAKWNDNDRRWTFPSGASLAFGYMRNDDDRFRYQSAAFQFIGFDELTSFTETQYTYMVSRLRRPSGIDDENPLSKVPLRLRAATNPGGRGHEWVKKRFITRKTNPPDDPTERVFIPSKLPDNPHIDREPYERGLMELDDATREQLLEGSWEARENEDWVIPDKTWIEAAVRLGSEIWEVGVPRPGQEHGAPAGEPFAFGIDWGEHTASYIIWPLADGGIFVPPSEVIGLHEDTVTVTKRMMEKAEKLNIPVERARYDAAGIQNMRTFLATIRKEAGWQRLRSTKIPFNKYKKETINYERILFKRTAESRTSRIIAIHPANEELVRQLEAWKFKRVADRPTDDVEKEDDHGPDALLAGIAPIAAKHRAYVEKLLQRAKDKRSGQTHSVPTR